MTTKKLRITIAVVGLLLIGITFLFIQGFLSVPTAVQKCYETDLTQGITDVNNIKDKKVNQEAMCAAWKQRIEERVSCIDNVRNKNIFAKIVGTQRDEAKEAKQMQNAMCKDFPKTLAK